MLRKSLSSLLDQGHNFIKVVLNSLINIKNFPRSNHLHTFYNGNFTLFSMPPKCRRMPKPGISPGIKVKLPFTNAIHIFYCQPSIHAILEKISLPSPQRTSPWETFLEVFCAGCPSHKSQPPLPHPKRKLILAKNIWRKKIKGKSAMFLWNLYAIV